MADYFRRRNLWSEIAAAFEMPVSDPQTTYLVQQVNPPLQISGCVKSPN
jgi:hypothetical protein